MRIDIATLFPQMCEQVLGESIIGRARGKGCIEIHCHNIRDYTTDKHRRVDDAPYGGGSGMVLQAEPIYCCYQAVCERLSCAPEVIYFSPQGTVLTQQIAIDYSRKQNLFLLCGHYEGVDERILEELHATEISIGDYVVTGGELPALVFTDSVVRLCDGVLSSQECFEQESHYHGLLEYPQYTRPEMWRERSVPAVLLSGHHANIQAWREQESISRTQRKRPDMIKKSDPHSDS